MVHLSQPRTYSSSRPATPRSIVLDRYQDEGEGECAPSYAYASSSASTSSPPTSDSASSACASSPRSALLSLLPDGADEEYRHSYGLTTSPRLYTLPLEEELDVLPSYTPSVQLLSLCRRKRVYTSADVKAHDRRWQLVWLLLDGTALRVYEPTTEETKTFEKQWREKYLPKNNKPVAELVDADCEDDVDAYEARSRSTRNTPCPRRTTQSSLSRARSDSTAKVDSESYQTSHTTASAPSSSSPPASSSPHPSLPTILSRKPTKSYPTRHIKCTRPTTYFRRAFLIQMTLENGKTFLVQLNSHQETLDWLNTVAVAAPLALDLDERVMVEANPFPRRRREHWTQAEVAFA